jgi:hypothetical protein
MPCFFFLSFFLFSSNSWELLQAGPGNRAKTTTNAVNDEVICSKAECISSEARSEAYAGKNREELVTRSQENIDKPCIAAEVECKANRRN